MFNFLPRKKSGFLSGRSPSLIDQSAQSEQQQRRSSRSVDSRSRAGSSTWPSQAGEDIRIPNEGPHPVPESEIDTVQPPQIDDVKVSKDQRPQISRVPTIVKVEDLSEDDVVIAVMGPTGSGKSTFISSASGHDLEGISHSMKSCTSEVLAIKFLDEESGRHTVLVDTPGFDNSDTSQSDRDILSMVSRWLKASYDKDKHLAGILYLHRITDNRMAGTPLKHLRQFRELCGKDALEKVYFTTTMWDEVDPGVGEMRLEELCGVYWKSMIDNGACIARCKSDADYPKKLVGDVLLRDEQRKVLQLQKEIGEQNRELKETAVGKQLFSQLEGLVEKQSGLLRRIAEERKAAGSDPVTLKELQREYKGLREQMDDRLRQMQELKASSRKNLFRFLPKLAR